MAGSNPISELYRAALPPVRDAPVGAMPKSLYGYVYRVSAGQQIRLVLLTGLAFPLTLAPLELQRRIVNDAVGDASLDLLLTLGMIYFAVLLLQGGLKYLRNVYLGRVAEGVVRLLRVRIVRSASFGGESDEGTKQAILSSEAEKVGGFVAESVAFPLMQIGTVASIGIYMLVVDPLIAIVALGFLVPSLIVVGLSQPILNRLSGRKIAAARALGERVLQDGRAGDGDEPENADADADAKDAAAGGPDGLIDRIYRLRLRFFYIKHAMKALNNFCWALGPISVLMVGGWLAIRGETEIGTIVAFISGYERMTGPARETLNFYRRLSMMRVQYRLMREAAQTPAQ